MGFWDLIHLISETLKRNSLNSSLIPVNLLLTVTQSLASIKKFPMLIKNPLQPSKKVAISFISHHQEVIDNVRHLFSCVISTIAVPLMEFTSLMMSVAHRRNQCFPGFLILSDHLAVELENSSAIIARIF